MQVHRLVAPRDQKYQSNFVEFKRSTKIVYRRYAGLFFCACVDATDNELAYLEAIHFFVEVLDQFFGNVCELDLVFNFYKVRACDVSYSSGVGPGHGGRASWWKRSCLWLIGEPLAANGVSYRYMLFWTRCSLRVKSRRRASRSYSRGWNTWTNWNEEKAVSRRVDCKRVWRQMKSCSMPVRLRFGFSCIYDHGLWSSQELGLSWIWFFYAGGFFPSCTVTYL